LRTRKRTTKALLDESNFHDAVRTHGPAVFRFVTSRVGPQHAEDVMAETFAVAWRSRHKFHDPDNNGLETWLIAIAGNLVSAHRRKEHRWMRMCADSARQRADASAEPDANDALDRIDAAELARVAHVAELIAEMPPRERDPLLLHVLHDRTYSEIAVLLDMPIGTVRSRISRGRERLARSLDAKGGRS